MRELTVREYFVMGPLLDDIESVETILTLVNHPDVFAMKDMKRESFSAAEVKTILKRLTADGLVKRVAFDQQKKTWKVFHNTSRNIQNDWFDLTERGRSISLQWLEKQETSK